ncbi:MAG: ATP-dependent DNA helicase [Lachnospiraceae bacterium]
MVRFRNQNFRISVRQLVEFLLRSGDITGSGQLRKTDAMEAGSKIHRKIQKRGGSFYRAEVSLKKDYEYENYTLSIEGRADGVLSKPGEVTVIDEIKGMYQDPDYLEKPVLVHLAQAKCYAYLYACEHGESSMRVRMTYCQLETEHIRYFEEEFSFASLEVWFEDLIAEYKVWCDWVFESREKRNRSIEMLEFPFAYRPGQKKLTAAVYQSIKKGEVLYAMAPTGVGKTISTLFPAIKAMGRGMAEKTFYLTAKTITRTVAENTMSILRHNGLLLSSIVLTAKEKICILDRKTLTEPQPVCQPSECPYAIGHYDRVNEALYDLITEQTCVNREVIMDYAKRYQVCPYELGLDASSFVDMVICDYNYAFDPNVYLKRYFGETVKGEYIFLVDEAHNLVERARGMFSAQISLSDICNMKKRFAGKNRKVAFRLEKCRQILESMGGREGTYQLHSDITSLVVSCLSLQSKLEEYLEEHENSSESNINTVLEFYFELRHFLNMYENVEDGYEIYSEQILRDTVVNLFCINPSGVLKQGLEKSRSTIFFSATLLPIQYYKTLLTNRGEDMAVYIDSPFRREHRYLGIAQDVSSKYTRRCRMEYQKIVHYLDQIMDSRTGNYFIFFPSYQMMEEVFTLCQELGLDIKARLIMQQPHWTEQQREEFLEEFRMEQKKTLIGFGVLGGIFSEGIDLQEEYLIGCMIVGTGLPMVCNEREILKAYFDKQGYSGFDYAYRFPGMNKVLQAAGRVIRTERDRGVILLLDERFLQKDYAGLFPREWDSYQIVNRNNVGEALREFWKKGGCEFEKG